MAQKHDILYVNFYTDGSAARKMAPAFPAAQPRKNANIKRKKKTVLFLDPVAVGSLIVAAVLLISMAVGLTQLQNAQAEAVAMENYLNELNAENERLSQEFETQVDLETVEKTALAMGMVPKEQATTVNIQVPEIHIEEPQKTFWDEMYAILANLFA